MALLVSLVPPGGTVVDVGCDHGHVAHALRAVGVERAPRRLPARPGRYLVANGLAPFRAVDTAVIAGMGPATLLGIVDRGPQPRVLVAHCPDGMDRVRQGLADRGWRIDAEGLAREGDRISEVLRAVPGREPHTGHRLRFGPLLECDPLVEELAAHHLARWRQVAERAPAATEAHQRAVRWIKWFEAGRPA